MLAEGLNVLRLSLFTPRCLVCTDRLSEPAESFVCAACLERIERLRGPICSICGKPVSSNHRRQPEICGECLVRRPSFLKHRSAAVYDAAVRDLIILYKFHEVQPLKHWFAALLFECYATQIGRSVDWVVPVPADRSRRRGFQPVQSFTRLLARRLGSAYNGRILCKVHARPPQARLTQSRRLKNLRGAFAVRHGSRIENRRILLVDDVYTTGTTMKTCARVLKKAGAEVLAISLARSL